jgi:hypothetical protein
VPPYRDLIDVIYTAGMCAAGGVNIWLVRRAYRRCIQHVESRASLAVLRKDIADITFGAMLAAGWGVLLGMTLAGSCS